jgi:amino acid permease
MLQVIASIVALIMAYSIVATLLLYICGIDIMSILCTKPMFTYEHVPIKVYTQNVVRVEDRRIAAMFDEYMDRRLAECGIIRTKK